MQESKKEKNITILIFIIILIPYLLNKALTIDISYLSSLITFIPFDVIKHCFFILNLIAITYYMITRELLIPFAIIVIAMMLAYVSTSSLPEIEAKEYQKVKSVIINKPQFIAIISNCVNKKCEMNKYNYDDYMALIADPSFSKITVKLPIHQKVTEVEKSCSGKIF